MDKPDRHTSDLLQEVVDNNQQDTISIGELNHALHERGFGVLMAIAALPLCLPIPVPPGYTTLFSIPLFILSVQMMIGRDYPWLPAWITRKQIKRTALASLVVRANPVLRRIEKLLKPRLTYIELHRWEKFIGLMGFIFSLSIAVPLPLTNLLPGYGILIMSLGLLGKDGITILIGAIIGTIGVIATILILMYGTEFVLGLVGAGTTPVS